MKDVQNCVLESALDYIKLGWKVLPLHTARDGQCACGKANCSSPGKHPAVPNGVKDASGDEATVRRWFGNGGDYNIGIATGSASGLVVLDIDPRHGGDESLKQFDIGPTVEVQTGSGGRHYYFALPHGMEIRNSAGKLAPGLDIRGQNGYIVAPPSMHICGNAYRWIVGPNQIPPAPCPEWMKENKNPRTQEPRDTRIPIENDIISAGNRNARLVSIAGVMRRKGCDREAILAALVSINQRQCRPPLEHNELRAIAESISHYPSQAQDSVILADDHHDTIARAFEDSNADRHRHQLETWIVLRGKKYGILDSRELKKQIRQFAVGCKVPKRVRTEDGIAWRPERLKVTPILTGGIAEALAALPGVWLPQDIQSPCWLTKGNNSAGQSQLTQGPHDTAGWVNDPSIERHRIASCPTRWVETTHPTDRTRTETEYRPDPQFVIPLENCLLDVSCNPHRVLELTEDFFTLNYLPIDYDSKADCPQWKKFLAQIFQKKQLSSTKTEWDPATDDFVEVSEIVADDQSISILQEYMGLLLTSMTHFHKILGIVGPRRSGKGTIGRVIRALVGKDNVASPTLSSLNNEHGLQSLHHKTVALVGDAAISGTGGDSIRAVERLKSISGEDSQQINPKGRAYIEVDRMKVRFVIMSNELQKLTDPTGALAGRFIYLLTTQSFFGKEDVHLENRLLSELPGILNWAIAGLTRLLARGYFEESAAGLEAKATAEELGSPVIAFVREWCTLSAGKQIRSQELYEAYKRWCEEAGRSKMGRNRFYEEFQRAHPDCTRIKLWTNIGQPRTWAFENIDLIAEYPQNAT